MAEQAIAAQQAALEAALGRTPQAHSATPAPEVTQRLQPQPQPQAQPDADDSDFDDATRAAIAASLRDLQACALSFTGDHATLRALSKVCRALYVQEEQSGLLVHRMLACMQGFSSMHAEVQST